MAGIELPGILVGLLVAGAVIFLGAVWFGLSIVAPRITRALDRADADEKELGDRPD